MTETKEVFTDESWAREARGAANALEIAMKELERRGYNVSFDVITTGLVSGIKRPLSIYIRKTVQL